MRTEHRALPIGIRRWSLRTSQRGNDGSFRHILASIKILGFEAIDVSFDFIKLGVEGLDRKEIFEILRSTRGTDHLGRDEIKTREPEHLKRAKGRDPNAARLPADRKAPCEDRAVAVQPFLRETELLCCRTGCLRDQVPLAGVPVPIDVAIRGGSVGSEQSCEQTGASAADHNLQGCNLRSEQLGGSPEREVDVLGIEIHLYSEHIRTSAK